MLQPELSLGIDPRRPQRPPQFSWTVLGKSTAEDAEDCFAGRTLMPLPTPAALHRQCDSVLEILDQRN